MIRSRLVWLATGIVVVAASWVGVRGLDAYQFRAAVREAEREVDGGHSAAARSKLARLAARWPGRGEVDDLLGRCEQADGRPEAALAAWARVPDGSPSAAPSAMRGGVLAESLGRFDKAERAYRKAARAPGPEQFPARTRLAELLYREGRTGEALRLIEANWQSIRDENPARPVESLDMLLTHIAWGSLDPALDERRAALERARVLAPEDGGVLLARANLATLSGRPSEAEPLLDEAIRRRPDDPDVWKARLDWAVASDRPAEARRALPHVPADALAPGRAWALQAWFAAQHGDDAAERNALELAAEADPADIASLERLAGLFLKAGQTPRAVGLRKRKADLDRALHRYRRLFVALRDKDGRDLVAELNRSAPEMARLAESLGRRFEARGFLALTLRLDPGDRVAASSLARLDRDEPPPVGPPGRTLADLVSADPTPSATGSTIPAPTGVVTPRFRDGAGDARLAFTFENGSTPNHFLPETTSGGVGLLDYDGDGLLDVYCVQGGPFPPGPPASYQGDRLFRNRGDGTFVDVTGPSGLAAMPRGYGHGVAVGDVDNDGHPDLFVTRWRTYALYRNRGDGTFEDATERAGFSGDRDWPTSAAFADLDNDGDLDLYVCHYLVYDDTKPRTCWSQEFSRHSTCQPLEFKALPDHLFRNDGGRFVDVTAEAGIVDRDGRGLGVVAADLDDDGLLDLFVANDGSANFLFRNLGGLRFEESAIANGAAANARGGYQAGMGVACGDLDGDGRPDLAVTNFYGESTTFYQNLGGGMFADRTAAAGLSVPSRDLLGFGVVMLDANDDGRLDLLTANGHVDDFRPRNPYAMPAQLLTGDGAGRLTDVTAGAGPPFSVPHVGRALAAGDLDNDGRVDALMIAQNEPLVDFRNETEGGHSVTLLLEGSASNRDGVGARVAVAAGGRRQVAQRQGGGSYQSASDPRLHFGLGDATRVDALEIRWPSGRLDRHEGLSTDAGYRLREGNPKVEPLKGWKQTRTW